MTDEIKATIVRLVETELRTVAEVCHIVGINPPAYYGAIHSDPDFAAALVAARRRYADTIVVAAKRSLLLRIEGFEYTETQELRVPAKDPAKGEEIKERRYTTKRVLPDVNAIMFALTNYAPDEFSKTLTEAGGVAAVPTLTQKQADEFAAKFLQGLKNNE